MIALLAALSFSCGLLDKADVSFDATLPLDFKPVNEQAISNTPVPYSDTQVLDATSNADVAKYKDKIKEFKVNKVYYEITENSVGTGILFTTGSLASGGKTIAKKASQTIVVTPKTAFTDAEMDIAGLNALAETFKANQKATIVLAGTFSKTPVAFKVRAYFDVTITAKAL